MKLGVSYNVFDCEELLEPSINCIRHLVDYISVVYQTESNFGYKCSNDLLPILESLKQKGLIDELCLFKPNIDLSVVENPSFLEVEKRNIGLELSRKNGCTHHMSMDCDEFYIPKEFAYMKSVMESDMFDGSTCQHFQFYKDSIYKLDPPENDHVSTIYRIYNDTKFVFRCNTAPVGTDPTRQTTNKKYRIFSRDEINMYHLSFVRKDIRIKLMNSSARIPHGYIDKIVEHYNNWHYPQPVMWAGCNLLNVRLVPRLFKIWD